ncbi:MAG: DUF4386 domain-containing protein [Chloroflexota bacterium]
MSGYSGLARTAADASQLTTSAFLTLLMGMSLVAMTVFLYPIFKKDSEALAVSMLLFRGALEGAAYIMATFNILMLIALGREYAATGADSASLQSVGNVVYQYFDLFAPILSITFLIGATCLYISFYRTKLIPRWLSVWGLIGVAPYMAYAMMQFFHVDTGFGVYLQVPLGIQELVMGLWLIVAGFNPAAVQALNASHTAQPANLASYSIFEQVAQQS